MKTRTRARERTDDFKNLLKVAVGGSKEAREKIDVPWKTIEFFWGDKHMAKKIVCCYYPAT